MQYCGSVLAHSSLKTINSPGLVGSLIRMPFSSGFKTGVEQVKTFTLHWLFGSMFETVVILILFCFLADSLLYPELDYLALLSPNMIKSFIFVASDQSTFCVNLCGVWGVGMQTVVQFVTYCSVCNCCFSCFESACNYF